MGEIAEMMLDGTLCEGCGTYIGEGGGFPGYCSRGCAADRGVDLDAGKKKDNANKPFIFKNNEQSKNALARWLGRRSWNSWATGLTDRNGQPMIGLSWDHNPDSDWSKKWEKRGLIICVGDGAAEAAEAVLEACK